MVSEVEQADVIARLARDVSSTLGDQYSQVIRAEVRNRLECEDDLESFTYMLVQGVQQYFHDCRVDITWPACPNHPNHPMWFENGMWCADGEPVAKLGELGN
jgi:hypothetical protein